MILSSDGICIIFCNDPFFLSDSKNGAFRKKHVINFETLKQPQMKFFDFGAFQNKMQIPSHAKIIVH